MVRWHHQLNEHRHKFEQTSGASEGQGDWLAAVPGVTKSWIRLSNNTHTTIVFNDMKPEA